MASEDFIVQCGLLVLRAGTGCFMLMHGWQKLSKFSEMASSFPDPLGMGSRLSLGSAIAAEFGCSLLLIFGLATRIATLPLAFTMGTALFVVLSNDVWAKKELAALYLLIYAVIAMLGPGEFSLDELIFGHDR